MEGRLMDRRVGQKADRLEVRKVDHSVVLMEAHLVGQKADRLEVRKVNHLGVLMEAHLVDQKVGHSVDLMEVQKGPAVTKVASLLSGPLGIFEPMKVVQLVVKVEAMKQARILPV